MDDVRAQVFSATGAKVGAEILVNSTGSGPTFSSQSEEQVAGLSNGGFVVTWTDGNGDDSSRGVKAQVFGASGEFVGTEILVNTTTFSNQLHAKVVPLKNGGFVVVWDDWSSDIDVRAQVFDNKGVRIGTEILANATKDGAQDGARIAPTDDGGFVVSWAENWRDVKLQAFDAKGLKVGTEVLANTTTAGGQSAAQLTSLDHGGFVVAWNDDLYGPSDGSGSAVKAQVFAIDQTIVGTSGSDLIIGGVGNDSFRGLGGNDGIDGSAGIDAVLYGDIRSTYTLAKGGTGWTVSSPMHSTDKLTNIERLQFSNSKLALDLGSTEHAGLALEFIGLMAPPLIQTPSVVGMILGLFDSGSSMLDVCQLALDVGLVKSIAGSDTKAALAAMAFRNVIGAEADAAVIDMLVGYMDGRNASYSQADFMAVIAGLEVNQTHIGLVGLQQTGVEYM